MFGNNEGKLKAGGRTILESLGGFRISGSREGSSTMGGSIMKPGSRVRVFDEVGFSIGLFTKGLGFGRDPEADAEFVAEFMNNPARSGV